MFNSKRAAMFDMYTMPQYISVIGSGALISQPSEGKVSKRGPNARYLGSSRSFSSSGAALTNSSFNRKALFKVHILLVCVILKECSCVF